MSQSPASHDHPMALQTAQVNVRDFGQLDVASPTARGPQLRRDLEAVNDLEALPSYQEARRFGKHKSEAEYLAALRAWVEEKQYIDAGSAKARGLVGFYGHTTLEEERRKADDERRLREQERVRRKESKQQEKPADIGKGARNDASSERHGLASILTRRRYQGSDRRA